MRRIAVTIVLAALVAGCATTPMQKWATVQTSASASLEAVTIYSQAGYLELEEAERIDVLVDVVDIALARAKEHAETGQVDLMDAALDTALKALDRLALYLEPKD